MHRWDHAGESEKITDWRKGLLESPQAVSTDKNMRVCISTVTFIEGVDAAIRMPKALILMVDEGRWLIQSYVHVADCLIQPLPDRYELRIFVAVRTAERVPLPNACCQHLATSWLSIRRIAEDVVLDRV